MMDIKLDMQAIAKLEAAAERAMQQTVDALKTEVVSAQVMPFDNGDMQNSDTYTDTVNQWDAIESRLITDAPQARRLYYHPEYNFQTVNNPNAGGLWVDSWVNGEHRKFAQDIFAQFYKKEAGI